MSPYLSLPLLFILVGIVGCARGGFISEWFSRPTKSSAATIASKRIGIFPGRRENFPYADHYPRRGGGGHRPENFYRKKRRDREYPRYYDDDRARFNSPFQSSYESDNENVNVMNGDGDDYDGHDDGDFQQPFHDSREIQEDFYGDRDRRKKRVRTELRPYRKKPGIILLESPKDPNYKPMHHQGTRRFSIYDSDTAASGGGHYGDVGLSDNGDRVEYHIGGHKGPHSYKFGFDTGWGPHRMFRTEEKDGSGYVHGKYGFYDEHGKFRVIHYEAPPKSKYGYD